METALAIGQILGGLLSVGCLIWLLIDIRKNRKFNREFDEGVKRLNKNLDEVIKSLDVKLKGYGDYKD